eukprot:scaffold204970_cov18-Tisochrysis_lutea.AAC.1
MNHRNSGVHETEERMLSRPFTTAGVPQKRNCRNNKVPVSLPHRDSLSCGTCQLQPLTLYIYSILGYILGVTWGPLPSHLLQHLGTAAQCQQH